MLKIEPLAKHHDKTSFDCENEPLNRYLSQYASQHAKKGVSKTYVLVDDTAPSQILGFYSLSANAINANISGLPSVDLPCALLGRLAVASHTKGQGLAHHLMANAFTLTKKLANEIGIAVIRVDLKHLGLVAFYERYGFKQTEKDSLTMYLMIKDIP